MFYRRESIPVFFTCTHTSATTTTTTVTAYCCFNIGRRFEFDSSMIPVLFTCSPSAATDKATASATTNWRLNENSCLHFLKLN